MMKPFVFAVILLAGGLSGCRQPVDFNSGAFLFGDSEEMINELIEVMLGDHETEFPIGWGGHGGGDSFAYDTSFFIKQAEFADVSSKLDAQLVALESKYQVRLEGSGKSSGDSSAHFNIDYSKGGILYFTDFLLDAHKANEDSGGGVHVKILHKGVRR